jgi:hypothetical protein
MISAAMSRHDAIHPLEGAEVTTSTIKTASTSANGSTTVLVNSAADRTLRFDIVGSGGLSTPSATIPSHDQTPTAPAIMTHSTMY